MMDKIAVISDIHGNMPALEAVLEDIGKRGIKRITSLGDVVGKGPNPDKAVDIVRNLCEHAVKGNWEEITSNPRNITVPGLMNMIEWNRKKLGDERMGFISALPFCAEIVMSGRLIRLFHTSAKGIYHRVQPGHPMEERMGMFDNTEATGCIDENCKPDVIGYGDIHNAYIQNFSGRTLFNVGSVGNPLEITQASYGILEGDYGSKRVTTFSVQLVRVPYDIELAVKLARESDMPEIEAYVQELLTAKYRGAK